MGIKVLVEPNIMYVSMRVERLAKLAYMITTLAAVKLIPIPPAFVESKKASIDSSSVNSSTSDWRISTGVDPVKTRYLIFSLSKTLCKMSRICVNFKEYR